MVCSCKSLIIYQEDQKKNVVESEPCRFGKRKWSPQTLSTYFYISWHYGSFQITFHCMPSLANGFWESTKTIILHTFLKFAGISGSQHPGNVWKWIHDPRQQTQKVKWKPKPSKYIYIWLMCRVSFFLESVTVFCQTDVFYQNPHDNMFGNYSVFRLLWIPGSVVCAWRLGVFGFRRPLHRYLSDFPKFPFPKWEIYSSSNHWVSTCFSCWWGRVFVAGKTFPRLKRKVFPSSSSPPPHLLRVHVKPITELPAPVVPKKTSAENWQVGYICNKVWKILVCIYI